MLIMVGEKKSIVTMCRISPGKKLHILPRIASKLLDYYWYLIGSIIGTRLTSRLSKRVLNKIRQEIEESGQGTSSFYWTYLGRSLGSFY